MIFEIVEPQANLINNAEIIYCEKSRSFDCSIHVNSDINLTIAYLILGLDSEDMLVKSLWGFCPKESWKEMPLEIPLANKGALRLVGEIEVGFVWRVDKNSRWQSFFDTISGWYCIGKPMIEKNERAVKIMKNVVIVIDETGILDSIWIHPIFQ